MVKFYKEHYNYYNLFWPVLISVFLTNVLNVIDSVMVSSSNSLGVTAISAATQLSFIFSPIYFAVMTGINIYVVQYFERKEYSDVKQFAGIAAIVMAFFGILNFIIVVFYGRQIISFFIPLDSEAGRLALIYLAVIKYAMLLIPIEQYFMSLFRATSKPRIPLYVSVSSAIINIVLNYMLIFGHFGFSELGIKGAAIATLIARFMAILIYVFFAYYLKSQFIGTPKTMFSFSRYRFKEVFKSTLPLIIVELGFGVGNVIYTKIYSTTSIEQFSAYNIVRSISMLVNCFISASVTVIGVVTGSAIAVNATIDNAKKVMKVNIKFLAINSLIILILSFTILPYVTYLFGVKFDEFVFARKLIYINGIWIAIRIFSSSFLAILRSGNDNRYVIWIDAGTTFVFGIPLTLIGLLIFGENIIILRSFIIIDVMIKFLFGYLRIKKYYWVKKL